VFGYPVEHSLSPAMHNAAIAALGLNFTYIPFSVHPDNLGPAIRSLTILNIAGVNLTIPHKERALAFLDELSPEAEAVGAVNTVLPLEGRLIGYNTDGEGFLAPLLAEGFTPRDSRALVLGAGGAARSVALRLALEGASVSVANRTPERAVRLCAEVARRAPGARPTALDLGDREAVRRELASADLLVNATAAGMRPHEGEDPPAPVDAIRPGMLVYDLVYNPVETRLLAAARAAGARAIGGVGMLVHQGAAAFEIWTGVRPPAEVMEQAVMEGLAGGGSRRP
jgi:shikimate dehydrogenase